MIPNVWVKFLALDLIEFFFNKKGFVISKKDFDLQVKSMLYNTV